MVEMNEVELAKKIVINGIEKSGYKVEGIFLFGSRARVEYKKDSDCDFYVIVDKEIDFRQKMKINAMIRIKLAELKIPNDIIIQSSSVVNARKNDVGYLTYYVLREGVKI